MAADTDVCPDEEGAALLRWFLARHFTQIGHEVRRRDGKATTRIGVCGLHDRPLLAPATLDAAFNRFEDGKRTPHLIQSKRPSRVHHPVLLDRIIVPVRDRHMLTALHLHAGLWTHAGMSTGID